MNSADHVRYRLRLADGFLAEARQDVELSRWRSAIDNAQLAIENAAKAVLAILGPVGRTHYPAAALRQSIDEEIWDVELRPQVQRLAELAESYGFDVHMQTDYGDEAGGLTPWEIFDEEDAHRALEVADEAVNLATVIARVKNILADDGDAS
jgi:HEPN domain-containing protein